MTELPSDAPNPRLCHIIQSPDFDGYGFNLHADKSKPGQYIGKIDDGSPADASGLKERDRIIEVNGTNISNENHKQVVQRIKAVPNETRLLVVDEVGDKWYKERNLVIRGDQENIIYKKSIDDTLSKTSSPSSSAQHSPAGSPPPSPGEGLRDANGTDGVKATHVDDVNHVKISHVDDSVCRGSSGSSRSGSVGGYPPNGGTTVPDGEMINDNTSIGKGSSRDVDSRSVNSVHSSTHSEDVSTQLYKGDGSSNSDSSDTCSNDNDFEIKKLPENGNSPSPTNGGLNFNMSAAEMRAHLAARKKIDPRKDNTIDMKKKYQIIQNM